MEFLQWAIPVVVGILGILAGRAWQRHDRKLEKDKEILEKIISTLKSSMSYARKQDFGGYFHWNKMEGLEEFLYLCKQPDFFFLDKGLEKLRKQLHIAMYHFERSLSKEAAPARAKDSFSIPRAHEFENRIDWDNLRTELNKLADEMCLAYDALISEGRKKL